MDQPNIDSDDGDLRDLADRLRHERPQLTELALDELKHSALARARESSSAPKGANLLKSRIAITLVLLVGLMTTGTGATLAVTGPAGDGAASSSQYDSPGNGTLDNPGVKGDLEGEADDQPASGTQGEQRGGSSNPDDTGRPAGGDTEGVQAGSQNVAVSDAGDELPFTGGAVLPLLIVGLAMLAVGGVLGLRSRASRS